jgi:hypothetical protein
MDRARLFLIEFNELCPALLQRFMGEGILPNFRRFFEASTVYTTDAQEQPPNLEPWIQWPTVHSGLPFAEHGAFHLGDGRRLPQPCVAQLLSDAGHRVGVCASMNLNYGKLNGYYLPDPWDQAGTPHPDWLRPFYHVIARQVQESSREGGCSRMDMLRFGLFLLHQGLTVGTAARIVAQLVRERWNPGLRWRRACLLDRLLYDVFRHLNRRFAVQFATFFCNSTAHFQHYYWRNMEPERFTTPVPATDHPSLRDAIPYGYRMMDRLIGRFLRDYPDTVLVLCTALSQQPWTDTTKCTYRPHRFEALLEFAGISPTECQLKPVMAEEFHIECVDDDSAERVEARLRDLEVDGAPLMKVERDGRDLFAGCRVTAPGALDRQITGSSATRPFGELFYMVHTMRSGRHHPDGVLWVRNGRHEVSSEKVPLTAIAPSNLKHFGVQAPAHMRGAPLSFKVPTLPTQFAPLPQSAPPALPRRS